VRDSEWGRSSEIRVKNLRLESDLKNLDRVSSESPRAEEISSENSVKFGKETIELATCPKNAFVGGEVRVRERWVSDGREEIVEKRERERFGVGVEEVREMWVGWVGEKVRVLRV
jgi:hypothetical protein